MAYAGHSRRAAASSSAIPWSVWVYLADNTTAKTVLAAHNYPGATEPVK